MEGTSISPKQLVALIGTLRKIPIKAAIGASSPAASGDSQRAT
jgi:hypothetical protein